MNYLTLEDLIEILDLKKEFWYTYNVEMLEEMALKYNLYDIEKNIDIKDETIKLTYDSFLNLNPNIMIYDMLYKVLYLPVNELEKSNIIEIIF